MSWKKGRGLLGPLQPLLGDWRTAKGEGDTPASAMACSRSFTLFGNQLDALPEAYIRYLSNGLRENFGLKGTPLRFSVRNSKNPYAGKTR